MSLFYILTIRYIIETNPKQFVLVLAIINGFVEVLNIASTNNLGDEITFINIFFISVIAGFIIGIIALYVISVLLKWTGHWIGGKASSEEIRAAYAWGFAPYIMVQLILLVPEFILFGQDLYTAEMQKISSSLFLSLIYLVILVIDIAALIWTVIVSMICLSEVQGFSIWKAILNNLLLTLIIVVPMIIIAILFI